MTLKRFTPILLAASIALSSVVGFVNAPAMAITSVDELSDVSSKHWAFDALRDLVEKYDVIEGYPNGTFKGNRQPTRWEMAAALDALIKSVGRDIARLGAEKADKTDLQTLARLQDEFRNELLSIASRTKALEDRAAAIEAKNNEQDNRLTLLEKTQIHGDFSFGGFADINSQGISNNANAQTGIEDGISAVGRLRLALDIPIKDDSEDSKIGRGDLYARLVAGFGRVAPSGGFGSTVGPNGPVGGYSRIASDADNKNNDGWGATDSTGGNTRSNVYLETAYYKQNFKQGIPLLTDFFIGQKEGFETTGDLYFGVVPWRFLFDKSPYRGNELTQFQNTLLVNTPGVAPNLNSPTIAYQWHQGLGKSANLDLTAALSTIAAGDVMDGLSATYEARLNYVTSFLGEDWTLPGSVYAGAYHLISAGNTFANEIIAQNRAAGLPGSTAGLVTDNGTNTAFYVGMSQELYKGIGVFANYMLSQGRSSNYLYTSLQNGTGANTGFPTTNPGATNTFVAVGIRNALSAGLNVPISALFSNTSRVNDVFGLGYAAVDLYDGGVTADARAAGQSSRYVTGMEHLVEAYYKYQFTDNITLVPSVQFIFNRFGLESNGFTSVLGFRTNYIF